MTWEEKTEMVKLGNTKKDKESREKFYNYVLQHIDNFELQDWDMLIHCINLIPEELKEDKWIVMKIWENLQNQIDKLSNTLSFRSAVRFRMYDLSMRQLRKETQTHTGGNVIIENINIGDIHYEYDLGICIKTKVVTIPTRDDEGLWRWKSTRISDNLEINYAVNEKYQHYASKLYDYEAYKVNVTL